MSCYVWQITLPCFPLKLSEQTSYWESVVNGILHFNGITSSRKISYFSFCGHYSLIFPIVWCFNDVLSPPFINWSRGFLVSDGRAVTLREITGASAWFSLRMEREAASFCRRRMRSEHSRFCGCPRCSFSVCYCGLTAAPGGGQPRGEPRLGLSGFIYGLWNLNFMWLPRCHRHYCFHLLLR